MGDGNFSVFGYLAVRKIIGILGIALPVVVLIGGILIFGTALQPSLSSYYHTEMRDVFVGTLFVIGFFLLSYRGYDWRDNLTASLACVFAVGIALFRATPHTQDEADLIGMLHFVFATLFFLALICFSLLLFTRTGQAPPTPKKLQRNLVYRICGFVMIACILLIAVWFLVPGLSDSSFQVYRPVFWLEALAIWAFGVSWITKGEAILADEG